MSTPEERAMATAQRAAEMIKDVKRQLEEGEEFFRSQGLDRAKVASYFEKSMSAEDRRKAEEAIQKDLADIEEDVQQGRHHIDDGSAGGTKVKRPRSMV